jgi:hypothetical protein
MNYNIYQKCKAAFLPVLIIIILLLCNNPIYSQVPPPDPPSGAVPIGGLLPLLIVGISYGVYKILGKSKNSDK